MSDRCPTCGGQRRLPRLGIFLPPLKAAIFDSIKAYGEIGITSRELRGKHYLRKRKLGTVRAHIGQINDVLEETDYKIVSVGDRRQAHWTLVKR